MPRAVLPSGTAQPNRLFGLRVAVVNASGAFGQINGLFAAPIVAPAPQHIGHRRRVVERDGRARRVRVSGAFAHFKWRRDGVGRGADARPIGFAFAGDVAVEI